MKSDASSSSSNLSGALGWLHVGNATGGTTQVLLEELEELSQIWYIPSEVAYVIEHTHFHPRRPRWSLP